MVNATSGSALTGNTLFYDNYNGTQVLLCTLPTTTSGTCPLNVGTGAMAGIHMLTAAYSGDVNNPPGLSAVVTVVVSPAPVTLEASCGNAGFPYGGNYRCEVNVGSVAGGATGSITYTLDSNAPVSLPLSGGFAQFSLPTPNAGPHTLVIDYPQQSIFTASDPSTQEFTVVPALSSVQLTPSNYYPGPGSSLTLYASVTSYTAPPPASGFVLAASAIVDGASLNP